MWTSRGWHWTLSVGHMRTFCAIFATKSTKSCKDSTECLPVSLTQFEFPIMSFCMIGSCTNPGIIFTRFQTLFRVHRCPRQHTSRMHVTFSALVTLVLWLVTFSIIPCVWWSWPFRGVQAQVFCDTPSNLGLPNVFLEVRPGLGFGKRRSQRWNSLLVTSYHRHIQSTWYCFYFLAILEN